MTERKPFFEKLALDDTRRPIEILGTVEAGVPEPSKRFLDHQVDTVRFPNGKEGYHHRITLPEGVMLAHLDDKNEIAFVDNYRHPLGRYSRELPSGGADPEERTRLLEATPEEIDIILKEVALREFQEEVGWRLKEDKVERLLPGPLQGSVGYADQTYHTYVGMGGERTQQNLDDGENGMLKYDRYSLEDAGEMIGKEVVDPATTTAVLGLIIALGKPVPSYLRKLQLFSHKDTPPKLYF